MTAEATIIPLKGEDLRRDELAARKASADFGTTLSFYATDWGRYLEVREAATRFIDYHDMGLIGIIGIVSAEQPAFTVGQYERDGKYNVGVLVNADAYLSPRLEFSPETLRDVANDS